MKCLYCKKSIYYGLFCNNLCVKAFETKEKLAANKPENIKEAMKVTKECPICRLVQIPIKRTYCSRECLHEANRRYRRNWGRPNFSRCSEIKIEPIICECEICDAEMTIQNEDETPLCSQECRDQERQNGKCNWDLDKCQDLLDRI